MRGDSESETGAAAPRVLSLARVRWRTWQGEHTTGRRPVRPSDACHGRARPTAHRLRVARPAPLRHVAEPAGEPVLCSCSDKVSDSPEWLCSRNLPLARQAPPPPCAALIDLFKTQGE